MKKVIVFGGTGWLGHKVALNFAKEGCDVTVVSRGVKGQFIERLGSIRQIQADKKCEESMRTILSEKYNIIIDTVPNVDSMNHIFKYAGSELEHYIHCSSTGGYAPLPFIPCDETAPYGGFDGKSGWATKAVVDNLVMELFCKDGFPATVIRPCYITGTGDMLPLDNLGGRRPDFIPDILAGKVLDLPEDGQALLQPIHVDDLADSFVLAAKTRVSIAQRYNICLSHAVPIKRYVELNAEAIGCEAKINYMSVPDMLAKYGDTIDAIWLRFFATHMCFTIEKARRELGYAPKHTPEETIRETARATALKCGATF
jgi:nucleoside-diphosphate-sugar epimerase